MSVRVFVQQKEGKKEKKMKLKELKKRGDFLHSLNSVRPKKQMELVKHLDKESQKFLTECMACLVNGNSRHLRLKDKEKKLAQKAWAPYQKTLKKMSNPKNKTRVLKGLKKQTGEGFIMSAIISAAIPLITTLVQKLMGKKK